MPLKLRVSAGALALMALLAVLAASLPSSPVSAQGGDSAWKSVTVLYMSDTRGKIEPCG